MKHRDSRGVRRTLTPLAAPLALLLGAACTGAIESNDESPNGATAGGRRGTSDEGGGSGSVPGAPSASPSACKTATLAAGERYRRLTTIELRHTLEDLLTATLGPSSARAAMTSLEPTLAQLRADEKQATAKDPTGTFRSLDQDVQLDVVTAQLDLARKTADLLTAKDRIASTVGACAGDADATNDGACVASFLRAFETRVLRRPPSPEDEKFYGDLYGAKPSLDAAALADVLSVLLSSPRFLYHVESGGAAVPDRTNTFALDAYELASRLSYQFWRSMPDDELMRAAGDGSLLTPDGFRAQADRVFRSPRTRASIDEFFTDWLKLEDVSLTGNAAFKAFAGDDLPDPSLRQAIIDDALALVHDVVLDCTDGSLADLMTSDRVFAKHAALAKLYGLPVWDGTSPAPRAPAGQRPGLLTRAGLLVQPIAGTRPIERGAFVRRKILCDEIPPPPPDALSEAAKVAVDPKASTRARTETVTQAPGSRCAGCHTKLVNPIGFAFEGYDSLGRMRTTERIFDEGGNELARVPVDTRVVPYVDGDDDDAPAAGASDVVAKIAKSAKLPACMARQYARFTLARWEDDAADGCMLENLRAAFAKPGNLAGALRAIADQPQFQQRRFD